jgi:DNA-directed RNA polymerase subunit alpha
VLAKDITGSANVEILNPEQKIATLSRDAKLDMELIAKLGRGYVPAERNREEGAPVDTVFIDAIFSPVQKVNFTVTNARLGQHTDYDRVVFEVVTDGSVKPDDAVAYAAKILQDQLSIFVNFQDEPQQERRDDRPSIPLNDNLFRSVDELEFSVRSQNCLQNADIKYIGELVQKSEQEMLKTKNFGHKSLNEIKEILREMGLELGMKIDHFPPREEIESRRRADEKETA